MAKSKTKAKKAFIPCSIKSLPDKVQHSAALQAISVNPANRPLDLPAPQSLAVYTARYWGAGGVRLGVKFLDRLTVDVKSRILSHMNAWGAYSNVTFAESASGEVRLSVGPGGYWSYLGTDILSVPISEQTMNLEGFGARTSEEDHKRVVRHETGHTLGFPHEHLRSEIVSDLNVQKTLTYFRRTQGWTDSQIRSNVLTPISEASITGTPRSDRTSIMCYQLPASITNSGQPIPGGPDLDDTDKLFAAQVYPLTVTPPPPSSQWNYKLTVNPVSGEATVVKV